MNTPFGPPGQMAFLLEVKEVTHVQRVCSQYDQFLFECSFLMLSERVGEFYAFLLLNVCRANLDFT